MHRRGRPTQDDIAREAGVSRSTVAKVLTLPPERCELTAATRQKVLSAARELGYLGKGRPVAWLVADDSGGWYDPFLPFVLHAAYDRGIDLLTLPASGLAEALAAAGNRPACVVVAAFPPAGVGTLAAAHDLPCVGFNCVGGGAPGGAERLVAVRPDEAGDMRAVVQHLAGLGHRRLCFAYSTGIHAHFSVELRRRTFIDACQALRLGWREMALNHGGDDLRRLMGEAGGPTALVLAPVDSAQPWEWLELRRRVPFALVVVGMYQNIVPITTMQPERLALAEALLGLIASAADGVPLPAADVLVPGRLAVRDTSSPPVSPPPA